MMANDRVLLRARGNMVVVMVGAVPVIVVGSLVMLTDDTWTSYLAGGVGLGVVFVLAAAVRSAALVVTPTHARVDGPVVSTAIPLFRVLNVDGSNGVVLELDDGSTFNPVLFDRSLVQVLAPSRAFRVAARELKMLAGPAARAVDPAITKQLWQWWRSHRPLLWMLAGQGWAWALALSAPWTRWIAFWSP